MARTLCMDRKETLPELKFDLPEYLPPAPQKKNDLVVIGEQRYHLNKSMCKFVSVGLAYDYCYSPCIKLTGNKGDAIIFDDGEWENFLNYQGIITNYLYTNDSLSPMDAGEFTIYFKQICDKRIIRIVKNNSEIYLGHESVCKLWELLPLIKYRIDMLKRQQFPDYFKILQKGLQNQTGNVFVNALNILRPNDNYNSDNIYRVMEFIYLYPEIFEAECCKK